MPRPPRADQGFLRAPLTAVFRSAGAVRVLRALSRHGGLLAVPTLERAAGLTNAGTHRIVRALLDTGVVRAEGQGRVTGYRLDADHPLAPAIAALFVAEEARADRVFEAIRAAAAPRAPRALWLFGSAARGEDTPGSDVDVAVVFAAGTPEAALEAVRAALHPTEEAERVTISVVGLWPADVARLATGDPLWQALERDALPLLGPPPALLRLEVPARDEERPEPGARARQSPRRRREGSA